MRGKKLFGISMSICMILMLVVQAGYTPTATAQPQTLKLGASLPMNIAFGMITKKALDVIVEEFNKAGGLEVKGQKYTIQLVAYDDQYKADNARTNVEKLIDQDKVYAIVEMIGTPTIAALPITEAAGKILCASVVQQKDFHVGNKYTLSGDFPETWNISGAGYFLSVYPKAKTIAIIGIDDESGRVNVTNLEKTYTSLRPDLKVVLKDFYPRGATDFTSIATKVAAANPDLFTDVSNQGGTVVGLEAKALYQAGYKGATIVSSSLVPNDIIKAAGDPKMVEGIYGYVPSDLNPNPSPLMKTFKEAYVKKYGTWDSISFTFTNQFYLLMNAIKRANSLDKDEVMKAVEKMKFDTLMGQVIMAKRPDLGVDRYCSGVISLDMGVIQNGQCVWKAVYPQEETLMNLPKLYGFPGKWGW